MLWFVFLELAACFQAAQRVSQIDPPALIKARCPVGTIRSKHRSAETRHWDEPWIAFNWPGVLETARLCARDACGGGTWNVLKYPRGEATPSSAVSLRRPSEPFRGSGLQKWNSANV